MLTPLPFPVHLHVENCMQVYEREETQQPYSSVLTQMAFLRVQ